MAPQKMPQDAVAKSRYGPKSETEEMAESIRPDDINAVEDILAKLATAEGARPQEFFRYLIGRAGWPALWTESLAGVWSGNAHMDARKLLNWAISRNVIPQKQDFTALGSLLFGLLEGVPIGHKNARTLAVILVAYPLCLDQRFVSKLKMSFQIPETARPDAAGVAAIGPEIEWRGPTDEVELQSRPRAVISHGLNRLGASKVQCHSSTNLLVL